jgi:hypothetical protein
LEKSSPFIEKNPGSYLLLDHRVGQTFCPQKEKISSITETTVVDPDSIGSLDPGGKRKPRKMKAVKKSFEELDILFRGLKASPVA